MHIPCTFNALALFPLFPAQLGTNFLQLCPEPVTTHTFDYEKTQAT
jgi:hypothetical protein